MDSLNSSNKLPKEVHAEYCPLCQGTGFKLQGVPRMLLKSVPTREQVDLQDLEEVKDFLISLLAPDKFGYSVPVEVKNKVRAILRI